MWTQLNQRIVSKEPRALHLLHCRERLLTTMKITQAHKPNKNRTALGPSHSCWATVSGPVHDAHMAPKSRQSNELELVTEDLRDVIGTCSLRTSSEAQQETSHLSAAAGIDLGLNPSNCLNSAQLNEPSGDLVFSTPSRVLSENFVTP